MTVFYNTGGKNNLWLYFQEPRAAPAFRRSVWDSAQREYLRRRLVFLMLTWRLPAVVPSLAKLFLGEKLLISTPPFLRTK